MKEKIEGGCLCGKVQFNVKNEFSRFYLCHCEQCRKITGSAYASNLFTAKNNVEWKSGEESIKRFDDPDGDFTKVFCSECGSGLPFLTKNGNTIIVPAGSLSDAPNIDAQGQIFWSERAVWHDISVRSQHFDEFPK